MRLSLGFLALLTPPVAIHSFLVVPYSKQPTPTTSTTTSTTTTTTLCQSTTSNNDDDDDNDGDSYPDIGDLPSVYPPGTPALLRGEAVRSALKSKRCIGWSFVDDNESSMTLASRTLSMGGILQIQGKGTIDFLNNKLTQSFEKNANNNNSNSNQYKEACLLDAKGRVVDRLRVSILDNDGSSSSTTTTALVLTSPGHSSQDLLKRLDPFIFPLDQVELSNYDYNDNDSSSFTFTLASTQLEHIHKVIWEQAFPNVPKEKLEFPKNTNECMQWEGVVGSFGEETTKILVIPSTGLPSVACVGYTFVFYGKDAKTLGNQKWQYLIGEANPEGPIGIGQIEYETLRVEAGQPAYGYEIGGGSGAKDDKKNDKIKTSPLELYWQDETIDMEKGCYLGQEGVASIAKNPRGPPRTLYSVVFEDKFNVPEEDPDSGMEDPPRPGHKLFALGSNEQLPVGTITSVGEANGTGDRCTVALALVRRSDSILKQMKKYELEIPRDVETLIDVPEGGSGMIQPPPLDPLDGMEVIIGGTYTVGSLKMIPSRGLKRGKSMFGEEIVVDMPPISIGTTPQPIREMDDASVDDEEAENDNDNEEAEKLQAEAEKAEEEAKAAEAEAERKAAKMELLRKRAEEAMARRKKKKEGGN